MFSICMGFESLLFSVTLKPNITDMSCIFEFGIPPLPLKMDVDLLNTRCEDLASGVLSHVDPPLKTLSASCKRMKADCSSASSSEIARVKYTSTRNTESSYPCLGPAGANMIGHDH